MDESILTSVKKLLGITEEYTQFDQDIITHINSVFFTLLELGVGPSSGFYIEDSDTTWGEYISDNPSVREIDFFHHSLLIISLPAQVFVE